MRSAIVFLFTTLLVGCAVTPVGPREYLDEQTAATITTVAEPWMFNREGTTPQLDFINLYAIDVNRMGDHRKYLAVVQYWPTAQWRSAQPTLEIRVADELLQLKPIEVQPREIGIGQPLDAAAPRSSKYWFYPIEDATLKKLAQHKDIAVAMLRDDERATYVMWKDGSAAFNDFATVALD